MPRLVARLALSDSGDRIKRTTGAGIQSGQLGKDDVINSQREKRCQFLLAPRPGVDSTMEKHQMMLPRPRFTLSVRSLMILVLIFGGVLAWKVRRAAIQRRAVNEIRRVGGMVYYEYHVGPDLQMLLGPGGGILNAHPWAPAWLQKAVGAE